MVVVVMVVMVVVVVVVVVIVLIFEKFCVLTAFQCQGHRIIVICYMALKYSESLPLTFHAFSAKVNANVQFQTRIYQNHNISS